MAPRKNELSAEQIARYYEVYRATRDTLVCAIRLCEERQLTPGVSNDELNSIRVQLPWLEEEVKKLDAKRQAFEDGTSIMPPDQEQCDQVKRLATAVDGLIANQRTADAAIALGQAAVTAFQRIQA